jgi:integrase
MVKESFGAWFREACKSAGVPGSAHGLRKAGATRAAENGATTVGSRSLQREHDTQQSHGEVRNAQDPGTAQKHPKQTKDQGDCGARAPAPCRSQ